MANRLLSDYRLASMEVLLTELAGSSSKASGMKQCSRDLLCNAWITTPYCLHRSTAPVQPLQGHLYHVQYTSLRCQVVLLLFNQAAGVFVMQARLQE